MSVEYFDCLCHKYEALMVGEGLMNEGDSFIQEMPLRAALLCHDE